MVVVDYTYYWLSFSIWTAVNTIYGLIFLCLFIRTLYIGTKNYGQTILKWMSITSIVYIISYVLGYLLQFIYGLGGYIYSDGNTRSEDSTHLPDGYYVIYYLGQFVFDAFGLLFITMMTFRLRESFKDTSYILNNKLFIAVHIFTLIAVIMIILYEIIDILEDSTIFAKDALIFLFLYIIIDLLIQTFLIYSFISKLYKVNKLKIKIYDANQNINLGVDTETNWMNRVQIENCTRHTILAVIAMLCECIYLFGKLIRYILQYKGEKVAEYNIIGWYIAIIPTWIKILCIYLSFGYLSDTYDKCCSYIHQTVKNRCKGRIMNQIQRQESDVYHQLHD